MNTLALALRNLLRNRRRSGMTLVAMVLGVMAVLLFGGYIRDINYSLQTEFVTTSGHLQVQHRDYFNLGSGNPAAYGIADYERIIDGLRRDRELAPMLAVVTPVLQFGAIAGNSAASVSRTVFVTGSVVEDKNRMRAWNEYGLINLSARRISLSGTSVDSAIIGTGVARVLDLCAPLGVDGCATARRDVQAAGDKLPDDIAALSSIDATPAIVPSKAGGKPRIEILAASASGAPNVAAVNVEAAEFQGVKEFDDVYVALHLAQAQKLVYGSSPPQVTAIAIQLHRTAQLDVARSRIEALLPTFGGGRQPLVVIDFGTLNPFYGQTLAMFAAIFGFIAILMGSIVLFTVTNTMSMSVVERTAEIGTLRAIGLRRSGIKRMFVVEGLVLGCLGALLGIAASLAAATLINHLGLTWVPPGRNEPVALSVRLGGETLMMVGTGVGLVIVAALSALIPAARAARMNIVDALRHV